jgi:hypothetical protein
VHGEQPRMLWRTSLVIQGNDVERGDAVPVSVGLLETQTGGIQAALQDAGQLELKVRKVPAERFRLRGGTLGGEQS